ncbi:ABC transporter permease [Leptolyngbya sp. FACHB-16]|uniref:ABC transporter permease n=1 Tax=unclassified Leptolyngbya TaxID=2650499 RepID=UPI0018EF86E6|nr:ABC transporter permease [Leptolyngbya sp. FACHB-16]
MAMRDRLNTFLESRFWTLFRKEVNQIRHNRQLLIQLLVPPTVFLILFGLALNPTFENLRVGITDYSQSRASRELIEVFGQTDAFVIDHYYARQADMLEDLARGNLTVAVTIPPDFERNLSQGRTAEVQAIFDAVDANTANVASGYLNQLMNAYNRDRLQLATQQRGSGATLSIQPDNSTGASDSSDASNTTSGTQQTIGSISNSRVPSSQRRVTVHTTVFYNPGLQASWFIVPGTIGILMTVLGSQAAASRVVSEKEAGTIEQLMMTPASNTEIIMAKIAPLLVLLTCDAMIAVLIGRIIFGMPFRGSFFLFIAISVLYFFVGISIGIMIATYAKSEQQAQLTTFFINPPLVLLSGANTPIAAMPTFFQWLTYLDPMRYYIEVCRGILLKGVGLGALWSQVLILCVFAIALTGLSVRQFRRQLS